MILCAAVDITFVNSKNEVNRLTVCGHRHGDCYKTIRQLDNIHTQWSEEGFIDHNGDFLNRQEAYLHALECGQINAHSEWYRKDNKVPNELYSEDLL
jgi:hypothetical protein